MIDVPMRSAWPQWLAQQGYRVGAEIGVYKGEFTTLLCEAGLEVYAIDPWAAYSEEPRPERQEFLYGHTQRVLARFGAQVHLVRKSSLDAVRDFADGSLDWVYLDGDHSHEVITAELETWPAKVRRGGVVAGHDYRGPSSEFVRPAVDAYVAAHGLTLHLIGPRTGRDWRQRGDKHQSFMWIQP